MTTQAEIYQAWDVANPNARDALRGSAPNMAKVLDGADSMEELVLAWRTTDPMHRETLRLGSQPLGILLDRADSELSAHEVFDVAANERWHREHNSNAPFLREG